MQIGIIDLLADGPMGVVAKQFYGVYFRKQFMAIMPQAIAVWCRSLGHKVHYATYYGQRDPLDLLPDDIQILFVASYTQVSALAYAISTVYRRRGVLTVIGGPHARSFPADCAQFFDIVVKDCDKPLVTDILKGRFDPPAIVTSGKTISDLPSVEERMPEIRIASFHRGRPLATSIVPILASTGCPYSCSFCVDWNVDYAAFPKERLLADFKYLSEHWPRAIIGYHDPNFAVRFDEMMGLLNEIPAGRRNPYIMESSLSILKEGRLEQLRRTNCVYVAPGVESWVDFSNKAATKGSHGRDKLERVVAHLKTLARHVPGVQANFIFGGESDAGTEPVALTNEFIRRLPQVWPAINIPTPFGGTPLYDQLYRDGRILKTMPFAFYYHPYLAIRLRNYDPVTYYSHLIKIHETVASATMLWRRLTSGMSPIARFVDTLRTLATRAELRVLRQIHHRLQTDRDFRAFHEGESENLPAFYGRLFERRLGRYAEILPASVRCPILEEPACVPDKPRSGKPGRRPGRASLTMGAPREPANQPVN